MLLEKSNFPHELLSIGDSFWVTNGSSCPLPLSTLRPYVAWILEGSVRSYVHPSFVWKASFSWPLPSLRTLTVFLKHCAPILIFTTPLVSLSYILILFSKPAIVFHNFLLVPFAQKLHKILETLTDGLPHLCDPCVGLKGEFVSLCREPFLVPMKERGPSLT